MAANPSLGLAPALAAPPESREERREMYSVGAKILLMSDSRRGTIVEVKPGGWYDVKLLPLSSSGAGDSGSVSPRSQEIKTLRPTRCGMCETLVFVAHLLGVSSEGSCMELRSLAHGA
jgi:hypothetical protein